MIDVEITVEIIDIIFGDGFILVVLDLNGEREYIYREFALPDRGN